MGLLEAIEAAYASGELAPEDLPELVRFLPADQRLVLREEAYQAMGVAGAWAFDPVGFVERGLKEALWSKQRQILESIRDNERTAVPACFGPGKMVANYEPVLTAAGWKKHGDLAPGDEVFSVDGSRAGVLGVFPQGERPMYRVTFSDGATVDVGLDHLWVARFHYRLNRTRCSVCDVPLGLGANGRPLCAVHRRAAGGLKHCSICLNGFPVDRFTRDAGKPDGFRTMCRDCHRWRRNNPGLAMGEKRGEWQVVTTEDLLRHGGERPMGPRRAEVPLPQPVQLGHRQLPVDPYVMGVLLGDGSLPGRTVTCVESQMVAELGRRCDLSAMRATGRAPSFYVRGVGPHLRELGVAGLRSWEKWVPEPYLLASAEQRLELLRGLMDTDGYMPGNGATCEFSSTSRRLADDVAFLARSLGGMARVKHRGPSGYSHNGERRVGRESWRVSVAVPVCPFLLDRKAEGWRAGNERRGWRTKGTKRLRRLVVGIEPVGAAEASCILVDHPSRSYVVGEGQVVTHNTWLAARVAAWWVESWPVGTALAVTTADKFIRVKGQLWAHVRRLHRAHHLQGRVNLTEWWVGQEQLALGFSAKDTDADAVAGWHAPHILVIVDEAGGISEAIGSSLEGLLSAGHARMLALGNPSTDESHTWFERICRSPRWNTIPLPASATPNFTGERTGRCHTCPPGAPAHPINVHLVTQKWVADAIEDYGEESPYVQAKVYARFPEVLATTVIPHSWLEESAEASPLPGLTVALGVDVASDGGDELAIARREGFVVRGVHASSGKHLANDVDVAGIVLEEILRAEEVAKATGFREKVRVKVDSIGQGHGVASILQRWGTEGRHASEVVFVNVAERARNPERFARQRDEMWWNLRELLQPRKDPAGNPLPPEWQLDVDSRTRAQLSAPTYGHTSSGLIVVESKDSMRKRGLRSPDRGEAVLLSVYEPPAKGGKLEIIV